MPTEGLKGSSSTPLTSLVPRQVMLEFSNAVAAGEKVKEEKKKKTDKKKENKGCAEHQVMTAGRSALLRSIAAFLKSNGFARTLEVFLSEAELKMDDVKSCSLDLEGITCKFIESRLPLEEKSSYLEVAQVAGGAEKSGKSKVLVASQVDQTPKKSKKKKRKEKEVSPVVLLETDEQNTNCIEHADKLDASPISSKRMEKKSKPNAAPSMEHVNEVGSAKLHDFDEEKLEELKSVIQDEPTDAEGKGRKKKKSKSHKPDSNGVKKDELGATKLPESESGAQPLGNAPVDSSAEQTLNNVDFISKDKKKKRSKAASEDLGVEQKYNLVVPENNEVVTGKVNSKDSKKRKKSGSEAEGACNGVEDAPLCKKPKHVDNGVENAAENQGKVKKENAGKHNDSDNKNVLHAGNAVNGSASNKRLEQNGSAEPKTVKAFQRVKVDEVQFVDERLQDNSYWAKEGAEAGYGAKAQEVLGQVRGRDFRHEKTKKKRGSYRGGQIDLGSHSIKFNYSDDE